MIGVLAKEEEAPLVEEFFQLFKTPWEPFSPGESYDVVFASSGCLPALDRIKVLFLFGAKQLDWDMALGFVFQKTAPKPMLKIRNEILPLYGDGAIFARNDSAFGEWEGQAGAACQALSSSGTKIFRMGYDLFKEMDFLLHKGQPVENALIPTLDLHIRIVRDLIVSEGLFVLEIPPSPPNVPFITCLTHDVDFVYLRQHAFDHTMWGFLYRATIGSVRDFMGGRKTLGKLLANWVAALKLPLVHLGLCPDFWQQFGGYLKVENGKPSTFFIIPFKGRAGKPKGVADNCRRATRYDVGDVVEWMTTLRNSGCEVALHGIDAWSGAAPATAESERIASCTGQSPAGVRMHWLYFSEESACFLDQAGFGYDSTCGFNETPGYRAGTAQVFKPMDSTHLLELPMHIQDTALFYPGRMHLKDSEAWSLCMRLLENSRQTGGVLTLLWHDRSLAPERLWGDFYTALLTELAARETWFGTAQQVVNWFKKRREIKFKSVRLEGNRIHVELENVSAEEHPDFAIRISSADSRGNFSRMDLPIAGRKHLTFELPSNASMSSLSNLEVLQECGAEMQPIKAFGA